MSTEPVGLSKNLPPQRVMRAFSGGHDLAVWRTASGELSAWGNRCPHRGMRLSYGFVRGDSLACAYHGWHFNCEATCHYMPAHPKTTPPATIKPHVFSVAEKDGVIWVNTAGNAVPPSSHGAGNHPLIGVRSIAIDADMASTSRAFQTVVCVDASNCDDTSHNTIDNTGDNDTKNTSDTSWTCVPVNEPEQTLKQVQTLVLQGNAQRQSDPPAVVYLHQWQPTTVMAHILARASTTKDSLLQLSRWAERVRQEAEYVSG